MGKSRQSNRIQINPDRIKEALKAKKINLAKIGKDETCPYLTERTLFRNLKEGKMKPATLDMLARYLDVDPAFLKGDYDWPLEELDDDELIRRYRIMFLDPNHYPYSHALKTSVDYKSNLLDLLALHGVSKDAYSSLSSSDKWILEEKIDSEVWMILNKFFPESTKADVFHAFEGGKPNIQDIIEVLIFDWEE